MRPSGVGQIALVRPFEDLDCLGLRQLAAEDAEGQGEKRCALVSRGMRVLATGHVPGPPANKGLFVSPTFPPEGQPSTGSSPFWYMRDEKMIRQCLGQLRGQFLQWGTFDLRGFVITRGEFRGWIRALEWALGSLDERKTGTTPPR